MQAGSSVTAFEGHHYLYLDTSWLSSWDNNYFYDKNIAFEGIVVFLSKEFDLWLTEHTKWYFIYMYMYLKTYMWRMKTKNRKKNLQHNKVADSVGCFFLLIGFCLTFYYSFWLCWVFLQIKTIAWPSPTTWVERTWGIWWCLPTRMTTKCISRNKERRETNGTGLIWTSIWTRKPL